MSILQYLLHGARQRLRGAKDPVDVVPLAVEADGTMIVAVRGALQGSVSTAITSAAISSLPSVAIGTIPAVNPTRPTILYEGLLSDADATLYTAAANWRSIEIYLVNVDSSARTATLYRGNAGADANTIVKALPLAVADRAPVFLPGLATGDKINGLCDSANKVKVEIWGVAA